MMRKEGYWKGLVYETFEIFKGELCIDEEEGYTKLVGKHGKSILTDQETYTPATSILFWRLCATDSIYLVLSSSLLYR